MNLKQTEMKKFPSLSMFAFAQKGKIHIRRLSPRSGVFFLCVVFFIQADDVGRVLKSMRNFSGGGYDVQIQPHLSFISSFFVLLNLRWIFLKTLVWLNPLSVCFFFPSSYCAVSFVRLSSAGHCSPPPPPATPPTLRGFLCCCLLCTSVADLTNICCLFAIICALIQYIMYCFGPYFFKQKMSD